MRNRKKVLCVLLVGFTAAAGARFRAQGLPSPKSPAAPASTSNWNPKTITYIKASNTSKEDQFGFTIALSADCTTMAVGAVGEDNSGRGINVKPVDHSAVSSGAVYIFTRKGATWAQQAYLKASNADAGDEFGTSLALSSDGNTLAVGAESEESGAKGVNGNQADNSGPGAGAVYIFARSAGVWSQEAYVKASNTGEAEGDEFGYSVALSGDASTLAVGAHSEHSAATGINGNQYEHSPDAYGAVYVFTRDGHTWSQQAYVKAWNTVTRLFGYSVALNANGNTMAVGSYDENGGRGALYIFGRSGATWTQQTRLQASNAESNDQMTSSLAISADGNTIAAGAYDEESFLTGVQPPTAGAHDEPLRVPGADPLSTGAAYVFVRTGGAWTQQAYIKATNAHKYDQFGWAIALSGDGNTLAVGAHFESGAATGLNGNQSDHSAEFAGAAYVYTRSGATWSPAAYVKASNTQANAEFGLSVALNSDGTILAVGSPRENGGATGVNGKQTDRSAKYSGAAYVYY